MALNYPRFQKSAVERALETRRVVLLLGARQCGKTTLAKMLISAERDYRTLDDMSSRQIAALDPQGFINYSGKTLMIDEIQHVPELLLAIKKVVDEDPRPGQFLLTGSAHIFSLPNVKESLAGRLRKIRIRPLTQGEILGNNPSSFLEKAFQQNFKPGQSVKPSYNRENLLEASFRGGFPEVIRLPLKERSLWYRDYMDVLLDRDLKDVAHIQRRDVMQELVHIVAAWSSKMIDLSSIGANLSIQRSTLESYLNALETLYLVERVRPWTRTDYGRVGRKPKLFMTDPGLMSSLLGWDINQVSLDADRSGKLIETFVFHELAALIDLGEGDYELYHYRDRENHEIDFIVERRDGSLLGIEVKAGTSISQQDFKHLKWFKNTIARDRSFTGIVLYTGDYIGNSEEGMWAVPMSELWNE